jgi:GTP-binding protein
VRGGPALRISAVTGAGVDELVGRLAAEVAEARRSEPASDVGVVVHRPAGEGIEVARADDGSFVVHGRAAVRAVALSDLTDDEAVDYVQHRLRRLGVERALVRAGVREGDMVHLGELTFTYHRDEPVLGRADADDEPRRRSAAARKAGRRGGPQTGTP